MADTKGAVILGGKKATPAKTPAAAKTATAEGPKNAKGNFSTARATPYVKGEGFRNTTPVGAPARPVTAKLEGPKPVTAGTQVAGHFKGGVSFGAKAVKNSPAIPALLLGTFLIVALAKVRGGLDALDIPKALFGGFIVAFILTLLAQAAPQLALAFAALIFVGALLELGPKALGGLNLSGKTTLPTGSSNIFAAAGAPSDASTGTSMFPAGMKTGDTFTVPGDTTGTVYVMH